VAFPRFYFVAPADLLDILSKGADPQLILRRAPAGATAARRAPRRRSRTRARPAPQAPAKEL
jgi:hypothetical protein